MSPVAVQKMSPFGRRLGHRHHVEAVHGGLERAQRIHLGDDHASAHAARAAGEPAAAPAVAADDEHAAGQQHVGRADDAVERRLAGAVAVVEEMLGLRVVDGDHGEGEPALGLERAQADDAGRRLLGGGHHVGQRVVARGVHQPDHVGAVVDAEVRLGVDRGVEMAVVAVGVDPPDREHADAVVHDHRRGDLVLCRERVRGAQHDLGPRRLERAHEVRRLRRDVLTGRDPQAVQRALLLEARANGRQHGHLPIGPLDLATPGVGQVERLDVVGNVAHGCHPEIPSCRWRRCSLARVRGGALRAKWHSPRVPLGRRRRIPSAAAGSTSRRPALA